VNLGQITLKGAAADPASGARPLALAPGKDLVARVVGAPTGGGRGLIALAGIVLEARLPAGLTAGQTLHLRVLRADARELVVQLRGDGDDGEAAGERAATARLAGELAVRGDGELLRAALGLADGPLWLPDGAAATVTVDPDGGEDGPDRDGSAGEAAFTLHCPRLGALQVRLRLAPGGVRAAVVTPPGALTALAEAGLPDLEAGLRRATGVPATAAVRERPASEPAPAPPGGAFDGYA
jgi:hypothetical protein